MRRYQNMLSLRPIRRFYRAASAPAAIASTTDTCAAFSKQPPKTIPLQESALSKLKDERDPDKLFALFKANAHNKLVIENRFAFEDTVSRLAGARRFDLIEHLLEHQKTLPQGRREGFIMRIIMLYGNAGMIKHAIDTFYDMHLYGCKRTVKSFNAALKVLIQTHDLRAIEAFLSDVPPKFDVELDTYTINIVIKAFCEMDFLDRAYLVMVQMEKLGIKPDVITYTTLISASYQKNRCEIGNGLWNLMVFKGCRPNLATFNVRIQYLINRRQAWQANDVMRLMQKIGIDPDEVTYNLVIKGFCQAGYFEMAKRVYSALECRSEYKPNAKIHQTMIHYLCKGGDYNLAYTMCKGCMRKNWFPNVDTIYSLLQGLMKNGQLGKAKMIMILVRNRIPPFSSAQLDSLQSVLSKT
ncbi:pentatricopeptide repeat-containing protein At1g80150, mitochondrial-like [Durio zibethinus]|uniref:Pentatricopeptide repeat-containing protein At1g80150, mitochondrial-like n=1 Tax=Durio zibethinus TaxID=66656 RepID=A0A6P5X0B9_DURZI|nr:pentatricopeptide repeat-containing protein At1g80150, mitochondrial-like [Durio zibethinus]XP_022721232.1 pentatricopeptide repeat-containing protein At1g80150, mitochondrial-like [Durio zibethinus]